MKLSRPRIIMCLLFFGLVALVRYAIRDMQLDVDLLRESLLNMPGLVMENIQMSREISGDLWLVRVPYLDREGSTVHLKSLDIRRQLSGDKGEWYFFGHDGVYSQDQRTASITELTGTLQEDARTWYLESNRLDWQEDTTYLFFPEGLTMLGDELLIRTPAASIDKSGVILLEKGGVIQWVKPPKR